VGSGHFALALAEGKKERKTAENKRSEKLLFMTCRRLWEFEKDPTRIRPETHPNGAESRIIKETAKAFCYPIGLVFVSFCSLITNSITNPSLPGLPTFLSPATLSHHGIQNSGVAEAGEHLHP